jgi:hypothetical protein
MTDKAIEQTNEARRRFLKTCGKFAVVTPPVISLMLTTTAKDSYAVAISPRNHVE